MNDNDKDPVYFDSPFHATEPPEVADGLAKKADIKILIRDAEELIDELQARITSLRANINRLKMNI